jgi:hypothetical protein
MDPRSTRLCPLTLPSIRVPTPPPPPPPGFLRTEQWRWVQSFHRAMDAVRMQTCIRCKERWFAMDLKDTVCHTCYLRDKGNKTPFLMSTENEMDSGDVPAHLPVLTQLEEMIITRSHVQMMVCRYRGHQYHYSGHCVSFMQNTVKTVDTRSPGLLPRSTPSRATNSIRLSIAPSG